MLIVAASTDKIASSVATIVVAKDDINLSINENNVPIIPGTKRPLK